MSWFAGKSEFQSSLGIGSSSSLPRATLAISTKQIRSEPHRLWASGKRKGEWIICSENAATGRQHIKQDTPGQITPSTANARELGYQGRIVLRGEGKSCL